MTGARLAVLTFGIFRYPADDPRLEGFHARNDKILEAAARSDGFIARSGTDDEAGPEPWGAQVYPRFYVERGDGWTPAVLSLWRDLESVLAFAYAGLHAEALARRREWFREGDWPAYAAWWVGPDHVPDWAEAKARHEHLHDHGPSAHAFDFRHPFAANGRQTRIDHRLVRAKVRLNAA